MEVELEGTPIFPVKETPGTVGEGARTLPTSGGDP